MKAKAPVHVPQHHSFANFFPHRRYVRDEEEPPRDPTREDWDEIIMPEMRLALSRENFQNYEIEEWMRRVYMQVQRGDTVRALEMVQTEIFGGNVPENMSMFFSKRPNYSVQRA